MPDSTPVLGRSWRTLRARGGAATGVAAHIQTIRAKSWVMMAAAVESALASARRWGGVLEHPRPRTHGSDSTSSHRLARVAGCLPACCTRERGPAVSSRATMDTRQERRRGCTCAAGCPRVEVGHQRPAVAPRRWLSLSRGAQESSPHRSVPTTQQAPAGRDPDPVPRPAAGDSPTRDAGRSVLT